MIDTQQSSTSKAMDYDFLRKEGIRLLQKMSGKDWTDYNLHDPGVTILEYLCYAITDLAYRTNFDIEDLLTQKDGTIDYKAQSFVKPAAALSSNAVTINDFRKILLDKIDAIGNVWIEPVGSNYAPNALKGLYTFFVQLNKEAMKGSGDVLEIDPETKALVKLQVQKKFTGHRNLCEDASTEIHILEPQQVFLSANIIISQNELPENIMALVYFAVYKYLNPQVRYYTEKELLSRGYTTEEIYSGPKLTNGFILDEELKPRNLRIDRSELYQVISAVKGVMVVSGLKINGQIDPVLEIDPLKFPYFNIKKSSFSIHDYSDANVISVRESLALDILYNLQERAERRFIHDFHLVQQKEIRGTYMDGSYYSIQKHFPAVYGISEEGFSKSEDGLRLARAKQLKAYLMFFEQIMANYLAQLKGINGLFSNNFVSTTAKSYFTQPLTSVPNFSAMVSEEQHGDWENYLYSVSYSDFLNKGIESEDQCFKRKNRMLDHLLARFNESISSYPIQLFDKIYGKTEENQVAEEELKWKSFLLRKVTTLSHTRSLGFNYLGKQKAGLGNDFRKKMYYLLYIRNLPGTSLLQPFSNRLRAEKIRGLGGPLNGNVGSPEVSNEPELSKVISFTPAQFMEEKKKGNVKSYPANHAPGETVFQNQPVSFLKHALNIDNYRLAVDPAEPNLHLLLYQAPGTEVWVTVNHYERSIDAIVALDELIDLLIKTSTRSEGFYLLEHILLRPRISSENFGFRFYNQEGEILLESRTWTSFKQREQQIEELIRLLTSDVSTDLEINDLLSGYKLTKSDNQPLPEVVKDLIASVNWHVKNKEREDSRFEMLVKHVEKVKNEDYFNFRMSIVLPEWPARFQDNVFKEFLKDLFRVQAPVHLRLKFYWLNMEQMTIFERLYASWLHELKLNSDTEERMAASNLSVFLETIQ
ncbi:hypothetical protein [Pedobacter gandavensis]|uniref:Uncharacterized protein n=1 Tax=Pedobacter gandavensis TaxID=2679963 RepID=A0ABR6ERR7_9SPHI|nr:hypothetical protein [Pedobacter gandavensis]MBB2147954.1 hypothetical protein [Pedobacter gandavensis]